MPDCSGVFYSILERLNAKEENAANTVLWTGTVIRTAAGLIKIVELRKRLS